MSTNGIQSTKGAQRRVTCTHCGYSFLTRSDKAKIGCPSCQVRFPSDIETKFTKAMKMKGLGRKRKPDGKGGFKGWVDE